MVDMKALESILKDAGVSDEQLASFISSKAQTDSGMASALAGVGVKVKRPDKPSELVKLQNQMRDSVLSHFDEMDAETKKKIEAAVPCFSFTVSVSLMDGKAEIFSSKTREHLGRAGEDKVFVDVDTGRLYSDRIGYLLAHNTRPTSHVLARETPDNLRLAWCDDDGRPDVWYDRDAKDNRGDKISPQMRKKIDNPTNETDKTDESSDKE